MARTKMPSEPSRHTKASKPSPVKHADPHADPTRFQKMNFIPERGFNTEKAPDAFTSTVTALGWTKFIKHRGSFVVPLVREFYQGIPPPKNGIPQTYSKVRGELIDFSPSAINEFFLLKYSGKACEKKMSNWRADEMEEVRKRICVEDATWEKFGSEFKMKKQFLVDEANLWFTFIRHSLMPTAHTTSVDKDRLIVLDAILKGDSIDVGKIIAREIEKSRAKLEGNLYFPCLITELCKAADVEIDARDERRTPIGAINVVFKPRPRAGAIAPDAITLEQLKRKQQVLCQFIKAQSDWEKAVFEKLSGEIELEEPPEFPESLLEDGKLKKPPQAHQRTTQKNEAAESSRRKGKGRAPAKKNQKEVSEESLSVQDLESSSEGDEEEARKVVQEVKSSESEGESETEEESDSIELGSTESGSEESSEGKEADEVHAAQEVPLEPVPNPSRANSPPIPSPPTIAQTVPETPQSEPITTQPPNKEQIPLAAEENQATSDSIPEPVPTPTNTETAPQQATAEKPEAVASEAIAPDVVAPHVQQPAPTEKADKPKTPRLKSCAKRDPRTKTQQLAATEEEAMAESPEREGEKEPSKTRLRVKHVAQKRKTTEAATMKDVGKEPSAPGQEAMEEIAEEPEAEAVNPSAIASDAIAPEQEKQEKKEVVRKRKGEGSFQPRRVSARVRASVSKR